MAITISGSGITSANIADGTIVNADLANTTHRVLQVVSGTTLTATTTSSSTWAATTLQASITPSSTSSKILVMVSGGYLEVSQNSLHARVTIKRGSTELSGVAYGFGDFYTASGGYTESTIAFQYLDSPATTASSTYQVYLSTGGTAGTASFGHSVRRSTITLMEIGA